MTRPAGSIRSTKSGLEILREQEPGIGQAEMTS
jgi:hypothetical protein